MKDFAVNLEAEMSPEERFGIEPPSAGDLIEYANLYEKTEDGEGRGTPYRPRTIRVDPGQEVLVQFIPQTVEYVPHFRTLWHRWHSKSWVCPAQTSQSLTGSVTECPLCVMGLESRPTWMVPVLLLGQEIEEKGATVWKERDGLKAHLLAMDGGLLEIIDELRKARPEVFAWETGRAWLLKRLSDWSWKIEDQGARPVTKDSQRRLIFRSLQAPKIRVPEFDEELVEAIQANFYNTPETGRSGALVGAMPGATFVPLIFGTKIPLMRGYIDFGSAQMNDDRYLRTLDRSNIALLCGPRSAHICTVDIDTDEGLPQFLDTNAWARGAQFSHSRRGGNIYFRLKGEYTPEVIRLLRNGTQWGEVRLGRCLTTLSGHHPCGKRYVIDYPGHIPEIELGEIDLPQGVEPATPKRAKPNRGNMATDDVCTLDLDLLQLKYGLRQAGDKLIGRCPACAERHQDRKGEHLIIYPSSGAYDCIVCGETQRIYQIVGLKRRGRKTKKEIAC